MYKNIFYDRKSNFIHLNDDERGWLSFPYKRYAYRKNSDGHYLSMFGDKLEKITSIPSDESNLFESDVPVETRILVDGYYETDDSSKNHSIVFFDIETKIGKGFPDPKRTTQEITAISLYSNINKKYYALILDEQNVLFGLEYPNVELYTFSKEEDLLLKFLDIYESCKPDILTGWNIDGFDCPYTYNRLKKILGETNAKRLSPLGVCYYNDFKQRMIIAGVSCLDYLMLYRKYSGKTCPNYRLDTISKIVLGRGKIEFSGNLNDLLNNDPKKYLEYNINDTELIVEMNKKLEFIQLAIDICHSAHVPYECFPISSRIMEGAILTLLKRKKLIAPNKPPKVEDSDDDIVDLDDEDDDDEPKFKGAYVKEPIPGFYEWVINADLNSLYPNVIRTLNISPETKYAKILNWSDMVSDGNIISMKEGDYNLEIKNSIQVVSKKELINHISEKYNISSNGILYKKDKDGILKEIITTWYSLRKEYKKQMKNAIDVKDKETEAFFSRREQVTKILLNSLYGVLGLSSWRFFDLDNALAVTACGQEIIKSSSKYANLYCLKYSKQINLEIPDNYDFITYIDTDSIYLSCVKYINHLNITDDKQKEKFSAEFCTKLADTINKFYSTFVLKAFNVNDHFLNIEADACASTAIWLGKKKYAMNLFCELSKNKWYDVPKQKVLGLDTIKSDFPGLFKELMEKMLVKILSKESNLEVNKLIDSYKERVKTCHYDLLSKNKSIKQISKFEERGRVPYSKNIKGTPSHVKAAIHFNDFLKRNKIENDHPFITDFEKVKYVYLKDTPIKIKEIAYRNDGKDPKELLNFIEKNIDRFGMFMGEMQKKIDSFYRALNWRLSVNNQELFDELFEGGTNGNIKEKTKKVVNQIKVNDEFF